MANTLQINDITYSSADILGLDELVLTISRDEDSKVVGVGLSQEIIVTGQAYEDLRDEFFTDCDAINTLIPATLDTDICDGLDLQLFITGETVADDPCQCCMSVGLQSFSDLECCAKELNAYEWWSNDFCENTEMPLNWYCNQPSFLQFVALLFRQLLAVTLAPASIVFGVVGGLIGAIGGLFGANIDLNPIDDLFALIDRWIHGCGRIVPSPLLRDIFEYLSLIHI